MEKKVLKILLSTRKGRTADGWAQAVQLHFIAPHWNLSVRFTAHSSFSSSPLHYYHDGQYGVTVR